MKVKIFTGVSSLKKKKRLKKEINDQVLLIVKYVRELKQAENAEDWDKVIALSDDIQDSGHSIGKAANEIKLTNKKGMHIE